MAKQIYIDENGNENLVSGTITNGSNMPMSANDSTSVASHITDLESDLNGLITETGGSTPISTVGGTFQIPASVLAHKIIVICFRRYGYFGQTIISKAQMALSAYGASTRLWGDSQNYWDIKISDSGVITLVAISGTAFPFVDCLGIG